MNSLIDMTWVESLKAVRSKMPLWTALASLFMPLGIGFLLFAAKNPEISKGLGLVGAKADLIAYSATDWPAYFVLYAQIIAAGGFFLFIVITSWVFGREFADKTLIDMLAVPVERASILLAKFVVTAAWSALMTLEIFAAGLLIGALLQLPGGSPDAFGRGCTLVMITAGLVILVVSPFSFFASAGRGYLLPLGLAVLAMISANLVGVAGWGEYYPWAVPGLFSQGKDALPPVSFWVVVLTGLVGMLATYLWWRFADQQ